LPASESSIGSPLDSLVTVPELLAGQRIDVRCLELLAGKRGDFSPSELLAGKRGDLSPSELLAGKRGGFPSYVQRSAGS